MNLRSIFSKIFSLFFWVIYNLFFLQIIDLEGFVDNVRYNWLYDFIKDISSFPEIYFHSTFNLGMYEIIPVVVFKTFSFFEVDYLFFVVALNVILLNSMSEYLKSKGISLFLSVLIIFSSFYVFKLCFTLHKLKIAIIVFFLFKKYFKSNVLVTLFTGLLAHYQFLILTISELTNLKELTKRFNMILIFCTFLLVYFIFKDSFLVKILYYFKKLNFFDFIISNVFILSMITVLTKNDIRKLFMISISTLFFGNSRLNIMIYAYLVDKTINVNMVLFSFLLIIPNIWFWFNFIVNG